MKIIKIKPTDKAEKIPAICFDLDGTHARLNACCRDYLGDPDYISIAFADGKITIEASASEEDYKLSKSPKLRKFSICGLMRQTGKIAPKTKIFGEAEKGKVVFYLS